MSFLRRVLENKENKGERLRFEWPALKARLGYIPFTLSLLRALVILGGLVWEFCGPLHPDEQHHLLSSLYFFSLSYALLYLWFILTPERTKKLHVGAMVLDMAFVFFLVRSTGGLGSSFYLGFYLLVALYAFHYGLLIGLSGALLSSFLYILSDSASLTTLHWTHLAIRLPSLNFLALILGLLSDRERKARERIENLNIMLEEKRVNLEQALKNLRDAQEKLVQSERLATIGKISAKIAHEIRNPLGSISLNAELLEEEVSAQQDFNTREALDLLNSIKSEVEALTQITEEYLRFARLPKPILEKDSINHILADLLNFHKEEASHRGIKFHEELDYALPLTLVDRKQLRQAFLNIIKNAFEAMPSGGKLAISTRVEGKEVVVHITDEGQGIDPWDMDKVFDPFYTTKDQGTGLGLTIARQIIQEHGGKVSCFSQPGRGTTFTINLPINSSGPES